MQPPRHSKRPGRRNRNRRVKLRQLFLCAAILAACSRPQPTTSTDDLGRPVALSHTPSRIVSLAPNITEMVVAAGGGARLVGTDDFSNFPPEVQKLPKVGDIQPNLELIARLEPDLVFAISSAGHAPLARSLANIGIPLFVVRADRLDDVSRNITRFGEILDTPDIARAAADDFARTISNVRRRRPRQPRVLFAVWLDPLYVAGTETFIDDLLRVAGAANAVTVSGWPQYSREAVAALPPDLIVVATQSRTEPVLKRFLDSTPPWADLPAVKSGFWYVVDQDRFARAGPRMAEAAADLNRILDTWERSQ